MFRRLGSPLSPYKKVTNIGGDSTSSDDDDDNHGRSAAVAENSDNGGNDDDDDVVERHHESSLSSSDQFTETTDDSSSNQHVLSRPNHDDDDDDDHQQVAAPSVLAPRSSSAPIVMPAAAAQAAVSWLRTNNDEDDAEAPSNHAAAAAVHTNNGPDVSFSVTDNTLLGLPTLTNQDDDNGTHASALSEQTAQIASAWFAKRSLQHATSLPIVIQGHPGRLLAPVPVDLDESAALYDSDSEQATSSSAPTSAGAGAAAAAALLRINSGNINNNPDEMSKVSSNMSASLGSEKTPVAANRLYSNNKITPKSSSYAGGNLEHIAELHTNSTEDDSMKWQQWFHYRTCKGRVVLLLLLLFVVGIITITVSATMNKQHKSAQQQEQSNNAFDNGGGDGSDDAGDASSRNMVPSLAPAGVAVATASPSSAMVGDANFNDTTTAPVTVALSAPAAATTTSAPTQTPLSLSSTTTFAPVQSATTSVPATGNAMGTNAPSPLPLPPTTPPPSLRTNTTPAPTSIATARPTLSMIRLQQSSALMGPQDGGNFGYAIALAPDGNVLAIGAPQTDINGLTAAGLVNVYSWDGAGWMGRGTLQGSTASEAFGSAVALSSDGTWLAASAPRNGQGGDRAGLVVLYQWDGTSYMRRQSLVGNAAAAFFGVSIAMNPDGTTLVIGAPYFSTTTVRLGGRVQVYVRNSSDVWVQRGSDLVGTGSLDWLGTVVDVSENGTLLVASAPRSANSGYVRSWQWRNSDWQILPDIVNQASPALADDMFGNAVSLTWNDGRHRVAIGIPWKNVNNIGNAGMVQVYELINVSGQWQALGGTITIAAPTAGDEFGTAVSLHGGILLVGRPGASSSIGAVHVLRYQNDAWVRVGNYLGAVAGDDHGVAVQAANAGYADMKVVASATQSSTQGPGYVQTYLAGSTR